MKWHIRLIIIAALLLAAFVVLACDDGRAGYCRAPAACGQAEGGNP